MDAVIKKGTAQFVSIINIGDNIINIYSDSLSEAINHAEMSSKEFIKVKSAEIFQIDYSNTLSKSLRLIASLRTIR